MDTPDQNSLFRPNPYVGLRSYGESDAGLFAGRDADIANLADLVADREKRLILLHGITGWEVVLLTCGRPSGSGIRSDQYSST